MICCLRALWLLKRLPLWGLAISRDNKGLACKCPLYINQPVQSLAPEPPPLSSFHAQGHYSPSWITPKPGTRHIGTALTPQSPPDLFQLASPRPVYPAWPVPSLRNHSKGSRHLFPCSLCLLNHLLRSSCGPHVVACPYWEPGVTDQLPNDSCLRICWPHHSWIKIKSTF